jgi:hypothetical protein
VSDAAANMIGCYPDLVPASLMKAAQAIKHEVTRDPVKQVVCARRKFFQCTPWGPVQARTLHIPFGHADFAVAHTYYIIYAYKLETHYGSANQSRDARGDQITPPTVLVHCCVRCQS